MARGPNPARRGHLSGPQSRILTQFNNVSNRISLQDVVYKKMWPIMWPEQPKKFPIRLPNENNWPPLIQGMFRMIRKKERICLYMFIVLALGPRSGSQIFQRAEHFKNFRSPRSTKKRKNQFVFHFMETVANLADHQWSAEKTLEITALGR